MPWGPMAGGFLVGMGIAAMPKGHWFRKLYCVLCLEAGFAIWLGLIP